MKKTISLIMIVALLTGTTTVFAATTGFKDVTNTHWAYPYVTLVAEKGIIDGMGNQKFNPDSALTLSQAIKLACEIHADFHGNTINELSNGDVWTQKYVKYASINNIISKIDEQLLDQPISRRDMFSLFRKSLPSSEFPKVNYKQHNYTDATEDANFLYDAGIVIGTGVGFIPDSNVSRAEAATIISKIIYKELRTSSTTSVALDFTEDAKHTLRLINEIRKRNGLKTIKLDEKLTLAATLRSAEIANQTALNPYIKSLSQILSEINYKSKHVIELQGGGINIDSVGISESWLTSTETFGSIIDKNVTRMGLGYVRQNGSQFWTLVLSN